MKTLRLFITLLALGSFATPAAWADGYSPHQPKTTRPTKRQKGKKHATKRAAKIYGNKSKASASGLAGYRYAIAWKKKHAKETLEHAARPCSQRIVRDAIHRVGPLLPDDVVGQLTTGTIINLLQSLDGYRCLKNRGPFRPPRLVPDIVPESEPPTTPLHSS